MNFLTGYKTYITAFLMLVVAALHTLASIDIPGFTADPGTLIAAAIGLIFARTGAKSEAAAVDPTKK